MPTGYLSLPSRFNSGGSTSNGHLARTQSLQEEGSMATNVPATTTRAAEAPSPRSPASLLRFVRAPQQQQQQRAAPVAATTVPTSR